MVTPSGLYIHTRCASPASAPSHCPHRALAFFSLLSPPPPFLCLTKRPQGASILERTRYTVVINKNVNFFLCYVTRIVIVTNFCHMCNKHSTHHNNCTLLFIPLGNAPFSERTRATFKTPFWHCHVFNPLFETVLEKGGQSGAIRAPVRLID